MRPGRAPAAPPNSRWSSVEVVGLALRRHPGGRGGLPALATVPAILAPARAAPLPKRKATGQGELRAHRPAGPPGLRPDRGTAGLADRGSGARVEPGLDDRRALRPGDDQRLRAGRDAPPEA